jgi:hypothetical protein
MSSLSVHQSRSYGKVCSTTSSNRKVCINELHTTVLTNASLRANEIVAVVLSYIYSVTFVPRHADRCQDKKYVEDVRYGYSRAAGSNPPQSYRLHTLPCFWL